MIRLKQWLLVKPVDINNFEVCRLVLPRSPVLQVDSLPAEPQGKPKDTGVGSISLHQQLFLTQESNWVLLHCRRILYQLSHQRSPRILEWVAYPFSSGSS